MRIMATENDEIDSTDENIDDEVMGINVLDVEEIDDIDTNQFNLKKNLSSRYFIDDSRYWDDIVQSSSKLIEFNKINMDVINDSHLIKIISINKAAIDKNEIEIIRWTNVDLTGYFSARLSIIKDNLGKQKRFFFSKMLAGIAVFLPILWTWWCLSQASAAFSKYTQSLNQPSNQSFLTLWHEGFGGYLPTIYRFSDFTIGAVILSLVTMFVLVVDSQIQDVKIDDNSYSSEIDLEFDELVQELNRSISVHKIGSTTNLVESLGESFMLINDLLSKNVEVATTFKESSSIALDANSRLNDSLKMATPSLNAIEAAIGAMPKTLEGVFSKISNHLESIDSNSRQEISATILLADHLAQMLPNLSKLDATIANEWKVLAEKISMSVENDLLNQSQRQVQISALYASLEHFVNKVSKSSRS